MVKPIHLSIKIVVLLSFFTSCNREPCIDPTERDENNIMTQRWFVADTIGSKTLRDENGFSQTLSRQREMVFRIEGIVEDDCGVNYDGLRFSTQYSTSIQQYYFLFDITSGGANDDDFYMRINAFRTDGETPSKIIEYNFVCRSVIEGNALINELQDVVIENKNYQKVLKINFLGDLEQNDIETLIYAQGFGLVQIGLKDGAILSVID